MNTSLIIFIFAELLVLGGAFAAYKDKFLFVSQLKEKGLSQGFPFIIHGAMWSDFLVLSPLMAVLVHFYSSQWSTGEWIVALIAGIIVSLFLHYGIYVRTELPGSHGYDGKLTIAGWIHLIYTALALGILTLFYFATSQISYILLLTTSVILALHPFTGLISQALANIYHPEWFPNNPLKSKLMWASLCIIWLLILYRTIVLW